MNGDLRPASKTVMTVAAMCVSCGAFSPADDHQLFFWTARGPMCAACHMMVDGIGRAGILDPRKLRRLS